MNEFFQTLTNQQILQIVAIIGASIACYTDFKSGMIRNWLTFPMMLVGLVANLALFGISGFLYSLGGMFLGIFVYLPLALVGIVGMGDVKLLGGIASIAGPAFMINTLLYSGVVAVPHALLIQTLNYGKNAIPMLLSSFKSGAWLKKTIDNDNATVRYHFYMGFSLFAGTLLAFRFFIPLGW